MNYHEPDEMHVIRKSEYKTLLNKVDHLQEMNKVLQSSLDSLVAGISDLKADNETLNAKIRVLKELLKEIVNG